jgi:alkyl hydroperoxide reductase subunit AhpC
MLHILLLLLPVIVAAAANWQPGDDAITPNPDASKEFFAKWAQKSK